MALFKKGKKGTGKAGAKKSKKSYMQADMAGEQYDSMITPRQEAQNMERVEEDQEEDIAAQDDS